MLRRRVCLVGIRWSKERAAHRNCEAREHRHVSIEVASEMVRAGGAEWILPGVARARAACILHNRLSLNVGETLAMMVYQGNRIARQIVGEIRDRRRS
jgi:hypothetical protein